MKSACTSRKTTLAPELLGPLNEVERKHAPRSLYVVGDVGLCRGCARVSVIGTREVSPAGLKRTQDLVRGVDTCARRTATLAGGRTIAVLGTPLWSFYPRENEELQRTIMAEHLGICSPRPSKSKDAT
ncbi:MAG: DNA-processing protein DprA [Elusimicrobiota bacterium]